VTNGRRHKYLVLAAMLFAVSMTFIDMTIVSIAMPEIQKELELSQTGGQWVVNAYLLSLGAVFALGGRLADIAGQRKMVLVGVVIFVLASVMNGLTPSGDVAEAWIIGFRVIQGAGAALLYPASVAIVISAFPIRERGRALAIFFSVAGGLTSIGPLAGGYLSEWSWRAIFFVNVPVALIAIVLTIVARPVDHKIPAHLDVRGALLIGAGMGLSVLGLQQASVWGWTNPATWGSIAVGLVVLVTFVLAELRIDQPLMDIHLFGNRAFFVESVVLFLTMMAFVPIFFFASLYVQISLGWSASSAGLFLLIFFAGFAPAAQVGGRILDRVGAKPAVVLGCVLAAVGFGLWAWKATDLSVSAQWPYVVMAGAGMGLLVGQANTDALNRAPSSMYGVATGITQTVRNYGSSLGMAVFGTALITVTRTRVEDSLVGFGLSESSADDVAHALLQSGGGDQSNFTQQSGPEATKAFDAVQLDFAYGIRWVLVGMTVVLVLGAVVALVGLRMGTAPAEAPAPEA